MDRQPSEQKAVKPERPVCLICIQEYVLPVPAAVGLVARPHGEGGGQHCMYKSAPCGMWVALLPAPVASWVCRDSQATTNLMGVRKSPSVTCLEP